MSLLLAPPSTAKADIEARGFTLAGFDVDQCDTSKRGQYLRTNSTPTTNCRPPQATGIFYACARSNCHLSGATRCRPSSVRTRSGQDFLGIADVSLGARHNLPQPTD